MERKFGKGTKKAGAEKSHKIGKGGGRRRRARMKEAKGGERAGGRRSGRRKDEKRG